MRRLYDKDDFPQGALGRHLLRNLMSFNLFGAKEASLGCLQILVTYNAAVREKRKKTPFPDATVFDARDAEIREPGPSLRDSYLTPATLNPSSSSKDLIRAT
jgi:hypothetical protein